MADEHDCTGDTRREHCPTVACLYGRGSSSLVRGEAGRLGIALSVVGFRQLSDFNQAIRQLTKLRLLHVARYIQYSYISINWFTLTVERVLFYKEA